MTKEELVAKSLEWLCYQCNGLFTRAGMDWRPTEAMQNAVRGQEIPTRLELMRFPRAGYSNPTRSSKCIGLKSCILLHERCSAFADCCCPKGLGI